MENTVYKVDSKMKPPVILAMLAGMVLIVLSIIGSRNFLFLIVLTPFLYLGLEILARKIIVDSKGITIQKVLRSKRLDWVDIQKRGRSAFRLQDLPDPSNIERQAGIDNQLNRLFSGSGQHNSSKNSR